MVSMWRRLWVWGLVWACGSVLPAQAEPVKVVASFSILADLAAELGGERVAVTALVGPDQDAHHFRPRPSDARQVGEAAVVIMNGLGFDDWMGRLARSAGFGGQWVEASTGAKLIRAGADGHGHRHHDAGGYDPHAWQDVGNARIYAKNIVRALIAADPAGEAAYAARAVALDQRLAALDATLRARLGAIPPSRRKLVTTHDAFAYFGKAYGVALFAASGLASEAEPSARAVARLIQLIRTENIPVVFLENVTDERLIERIRSESGARAGGRLYSDALSGPEGPAASYEAMIRHNLATLEAALRP